MDPPESAKRRKKTENSDLDSAIADQNLSNPSILDDDAHAKDLYLAVHGAKRGPKPGTNLNKKRKADYEYSTNPNTIKARARMDKMGVV